MELSRVNIQLFRGGLVFSLGICRYWIFCHILGFCNLSAYQHTKKLSQKRMTGFWLNVHRPYQVFNHKLTLYLLGCLVNRIFGIFEEIFGLMTNEILEFSCENEDFLWQERRDKICTIGSYSMNYKIQKNWRFSCWDIAKIVPGCRKICQDLSKNFNWSVDQYCLQIGLESDFRMVISQLIE